MKLSSVYLITKVSQIRHRFLNCPCLMITRTRVFLREQFCHVFRTFSVHMTSTQITQQFRSGTETISANVSDVQILQY